MADCSTLTVNIVLLFFGSINNMVLISREVTNFYVLRVGEPTEGHVRRSIPIQTNPRRSQHQYSAAPTFCGWRRFSVVMDTV